MIPGAVLAHAAHEVAGAQRLLVAASIHLEEVQFESAVNLPAIVSALGELTAAVVTAADEQGHAEAVRLSEASRRRDALDADGVRRHE